VLASVAAEERRAAKAATGWPIPLRIAAVAAACLALAAGQWLLAMDSVQGLLGPLVTVVADAERWLAALAALGRAAQVSTGAVFGNRAVSLILMATGTAVTLVSLGAAIGFRYILNLENGRTA